ncbi:MULTISPECIES: VOC family protein [unclassified Streptomyces]|uniref:VOC family protein n=1 Tax=unclassified Streptomyces TaxID=2593676 RepID=UPI0036BCF143
MSEQPYFHIGVVVPDLEKAIEYYERTQGLEFTKPAHVTNPRLEDPHPHEQVVHVAFSKQGPPYYELIEADGDEGIFSTANEGRILYLGLWEPDMEGRLGALAAEGIGVAAASRSAEGATPGWIITEPDALGVRYEYVDLAEKQAIETWIETDEFPGL